MGVQLCAEVHDSKPTCPYSIACSLQHALPPFYCLSLVPSSLHAVWAALCFLGLVSVGIPPPLTNASACTPVFVGLV